jgi:hypothetical protein
VKDHDEKVNHHDEKDHQNEEDCHDDALLKLNFKIDITDVFDVSFDNFSKINRLKNF